MSRTDERTKRGEAGAPGAAAEDRDEAVIAEEFGGLDNDLVDMTTLSRSPADREDDGLGPADEDEDEPGLPDGGASGTDRAGDDVDETSAGGLRFPDEAPTRR
ncbi:hypothetical protein ASG43_06060 [Aureimonas sp. Leaf454]|uniref:hypothetical protein n=1 Tax=Aureimonas sp. Leaf454 TaxID=1736381 RepID=UPI0006FCC032|nr:hypothetical protein [Aureimonas sp. Leaf454]KQT50825.1 hypothetical protein ASG43_06060 [Aureimonas sp. Leaf454]